MEIKTGMIVNVIDWGQEYSTNKQWFEDHYNKGDIPLDYIIRYAFDDQSNYAERRYMDTTEYKVLFVDNTEQKALITESDECGYNATEYGWNKTYLVGLDGIEPLKKEMTLKQIEEILGYRVKIVESNKF